MAPVEVYVSDKLIGISGNRLSLLKDPASSITVSYAGDHCGQGAVYDCRGNIAVRFRLEEGQGVKRPVQAADIPSIESGQEPTPVQRDVLVVRQKTSK